MRTHGVQQHHRTVDRITRILETVVYRPGITFSELARALDAPKGSVHGFISGLLAAGWLYEQDHRFYLGPAVYALTLVSGHIRAGLATHADLAALHEATGAAVFLAVQVGDHLVNIGEVGSEALAGGFLAQSDIRRPLLRTAGGKALLAARSAAEREAYLRRHVEEDPEAVDEFLAEYGEIVRTRIATHLRLSGTRFAMGTAVRNHSGEAVASVTLIGPTPDLQPRMRQLGDLLIRHLDIWSHRSMIPREAIWSPHIDEAWLPRGGPLPRFYEPLLGTAGLRIGEALGLKWGDVDQNTGRLQVKRALQRQRGRGLVFVETKTPRSRRLIHLSSIAGEAIREQRGHATGELVFPNRSGGPQESSSVTAALRVALKRAGLPGIRVHDLRHTTATVLLEAGAHPKLVQELLGHSTVALTLNTYSHVTAGLSEEAARTIDRVLRLPSVRS